MLDVRDTTFVRGIIREEITAALGALKARIAQRSVDESRWSMGDVVVADRPLRMVAEELEKLIEERNAEE